MKSLSLIAFVVIAFGALSLSACSGCSQQDKDAAKKKDVPPPTYCGQGTVPQGGQCVPVSK